MVMEDDKRDNQINESVAEIVKQIELFNKEEVFDEKDDSAKVELFFSFDIVNSTAFKEKNGNWLEILTGVIRDLNKCVQGRILQSKLWRIIGDELVFKCEIKNIDEIYEIIDSVYMILIEKNGQILKGDLSNKANEELNTCYLQAAAWIAAIKKYDKDYNKAKYDNIRMDYKIANNRTINDFLGPDIDTGFRIKKETEKRRMVVSFELAYLLSERTEYSNRLNILTYKTLKGVWEGKPYPIIWYYDERRHKEIPFGESFSYDESILSEFAKEYFRNIENKNGFLPQILFGNSNKTLKKLSEDRGLTEKINYLKNLIKISASDTTAISDEFGEKIPELHFAAICCDVPNRKIMLVKRSGRESLDNKWEFGCTKATSEEHLEETIIRDYRDKFGIDIEIIRDFNRSEKRAIPIALYEVEKIGKIHKGVLVVARIIGGIEKIEETIRCNGRHDSVKWIGEEEIENFNEDSVRDIKESMKKVFNNWNNYFVK